MRGSLPDNVRMVQVQSRCDTTVISVLSPVLALRPTHCRSALCVRVCVRAHVQHNQSAYTAIVSLDRNLIEDDLPTIHRIINNTYTHISAKAPTRTALTAIRFASIRCVPLCVRGVLWPLFVARSIDIDFMMSICLFYSLQMIYVVDLGASTFCLFFPCPHARLTCSLRCPIIRMALTHTAEKHLVPLQKLDLDSAIHGRLHHKHLRAR